KQVYRQMLCIGSIKVKQNIGSDVRYGRIEARDGYLVMSDLHELTPDDAAIILEFDDVMSLMGKPLDVFLDMMHPGTKTFIGCLHIRLDGTAHKHIQQLLLLSTGASGRGSWRRAGLDLIWDKGAPGEVVHCPGYRTTTGGIDWRCIQEVEEEQGTGNDVAHTEGLVCSWGGQTAAFSITTRTREPDAIIQFPVIGHVTRGLTELRAAIHDYAVIKKRGGAHDIDIEFIACGVVIGYNF
ncbi:unnamed protein product, partial [Meganyctiphanes norvegica]